MPLPFRASSQLDSDANGLLGVEELTEDEFNQLKPEEGE